MLVIIKIIVWKNVHLLSLIKQHRGTPLHSVEYVADQASRGTRLVSRIPVKQAALYFGKYNISSPIDHLEPIASRCLFCEGKGKGSP